ncbi:hypothetical protein [Ktedonospora formicarum]|nr:hypothetical protein [Ktedonospora formicarum]
MPVKAFAPPPTDVVQKAVGYPQRNLKQYQVPNVDALIWLPSSGLIVTGDNSGQIVSWNVTNGKTAHTYKQLDPRVISRTWGLTCTPDGAFIAACFLTDSASEKLVQVWESRSGKRLFQYPPEG